MAATRIINLANVQQFAAINLTSDPGYDPSDRKIPNCAQIRLIWSNDSGRAHYNVLHGRYAGSFSGTQQQANAILAALIAGANWSAFAGFLAPITILQAVDIRDLNTEDQPTILSNATGAAGTSTGTPLPLEIAAVLTERTAFVGPANRGRIYVGGWATNALGTGNQMAAGAVTALGNWGSIIAGALAGSGYTLSIGHFSRLAYTGVGGKPHPARLAGTVPVTTVSVLDNHWDSQRRRGLA